MARSDRPQEPLLFDLPLGEGSEPEPDEGPPPAGAGEPEPGLPFPAAPADELDALAPAEPEPFAGPEIGPEIAPPPGARRLVGARLRAALADLALIVGVLLVVLAGLWVAGRPPRLDDAPAIAVFLLAFSFLYWVLPLAFWGRTPGMAYAELVARSLDGQPLIFRQTVLRWLGAVLTVALAGLPLLIAPGGRSLTDRLSGSVTRSTR